jgi:acyl-CoA synthetase (NDP forming)
VATLVKKGIRDILSAAKDVGWVLEPQAKRLFSMAGLDVPRFTMSTTVEEAVQFAHKIGYPIVAKVVSPRIVHKSDSDGVAISIDTDGELTETFNRFSQVEGSVGVLVEEMMSGIELMVGAKIDYQFGPVILVGIGGTGVEIYRDVTVRMAPVREKDVEAMVKGLKASPLLEGHRGSEPINLGELTRLLVTFSDLVMDLEEFIESIDLNPVICSSTRCVVADARIMLKEEGERA